MGTATITVRYVNEVKPGKKTGTIKTETDEYIMVEPQDLRLFQPGGVYDIKYEDMVFKTGGGMKKFVSMIYPVVTGAVVNNPSVQAQPTQASQHPVPQHNQQSLEMGVMGFLARFYAGSAAAGVLPPTSGDIAHLVRSYKLAWELGLSDSPMPIDPPKNLSTDIGPNNEILF